MTEGRLPRSFQWVKIDIVATKNTFDTGGATDEPRRNNEKKPPSERALGGTHNAYPSSPAV